MVGRKGLEPSHLSALEPKGLVHINPKTKSKIADKLLLKKLKDLFFPQIW